ncbi:MAG: CRISPR-associated endonuclease Cas2 [Coriobacteriia bacterium]|nr:CRISPR-associated endonuclease Cas2 [Coriobacteriia bacterium]
MASHKLVVAYDITNDKARRHVVKLLDQYGKRVQRSVYRLELSKDKYAEFITRLRDLFFRLQSARYHVGKQVLSIIVIPLCKNCDSTSLFLGEKPMEDQRYLLV